MNTLLNAVETVNNSTNFVSHKDAVQMVRKQVVATGNKTIYNHFSKAELLDMLNQPGAEGINFYFGLNDAGSNTLIAIGAKEDESNLKTVNVNGEVVTSNKLMIGGSSCQCKL